MGPSAAPIDAIGDYRIVLDVIGAPALLTLLVSALLHPRRQPGREVLTSDEGPRPTPITRRQGNPLAIADRRPGGMR
ncbi:hypothetical protein Asera_60280 [Actinocatenispora sera]|uniref:Uncharacterized protein n=1 Tax=Actinocatenispora sera TaxID=390989 RepID=A0A810L8Q6_9ACTN|nr:hypothetical protein Asera_60280 [Actinocatenispora sera]